MQQLTMRFGRTAKVLAKWMLKYYRISVVQLQAVLQCSQQAQDMQPGITQKGWLEWLHGSVILWVDEFISSADMYLR